MSDEERIAEAVAEERRKIRLYCWRQHRRLKDVYPESAAAFKKIADDVEAGEHLKKEGT